MGASLPALEDIRAAREMTGEFKGYNHNPRIRPGEFFDMQNLGADRYPLLAPRKQRGRVRQFEKPNGLFAHEKLAWVDGTALFYGGEQVGAVEDSPKRFVGMGAYILIWPDKVFYNTATGEFGPLGNRTVTAGTVTITLCKLDGTAYTNYTAGAAAPANPADGKLWVDTSNTPHVLKQYAAAYGMWVSVPTTYVKIAAAGIGKGFAEYDGVTISGLENEALNGAFILYGAGEDFILVAAIIDAAATQAGAVTVERGIPDLDYLTESGNRVWGCSSAKHEIYACALGDPKNWNKFLGVSTDSYALSVGAGGAFTGCIAHLGYVLFFKEDVILKVYGNKPSNFQLSDTVCRGVEKGSGRSLCIVNETLYYKARGDVCAYNAALPASISEALGPARYRDAAAGALGSRYYISMKDEKGAGALFVYDEDRGLWHKEDDTYAPYFAALGPELYFISSRDNCLYSVGGSLPEAYADGDAAPEGPVAWFAQTGDIGLDSPDNKYVSKLQLRLEAAPDALVRLEVQYDQETAWEEKFRMGFTKRRTVTVPILPRRCDTLRLRLSGRGDCRVYSLTKTIEQGSEV